jgi:hypothetical protein
MSICGPISLLSNSTFKPTCFLVTVFLSTSPLFQKWSNATEHTRDGSHRYNFAESLETFSADSRLLPNVCDIQKENHTLGYGFNNLQKICSPSLMDFYSLWFPSRTFVLSGNLVSALLKGFIFLYYSWCAVGGTHGVLPAVALCPVPSGGPQWGQVGREIQPQSPRLQDQRKWVGHWYPCTYRCIFPMTKEL